DLENKLENSNSSEDFVVLNSELKRVIEFYSNCNEIVYVIDENRIDLEYELEMIDAFSFYQDSVNQDSTLKNKKFELINVPKSWSNYNNSSYSVDSCEIIYTGILISHDKRIQYAVAYSKFKNEYYRVLIRQKEETN